MLWVRKSPGNEVAKLQLTLHEAELFHKESTVLRVWFGKDIKEDVFGVILVDSN